jgi:hypothetical protein
MILFIIVGGGGVSLHLKAKATPSNPHELGPRVYNVNVQYEGGSAMFCRKLETLEVTRRRPGRASKEGAYGGTKMENASRGCHASPCVLSIEYTVGVI